MSYWTKLHKTSQLFGFDPVKTARALRRLPYYFRTLRAYRLSSRRANYAFSTLMLYPILEDLGEDAGSLMIHCFHQDLWAASKIYQQMPPRHVDIGSRIDGFIAHLLVFMPVEIVDIRPLSSDIRGLTFVRGDATDLRQFADSSVVSLSTLHAIQNFGLGRYGDPIDADAPFKAMREFVRILAPGGRLYFALPIGRERVEFNAQRVFNPATIIAALRGLELVSFSAVDDAGRFMPDVSMNGFAEAHYACGLFEFTK